MNTCPTPDIVELHIARATQKRNVDGHVCHFKNCNIRNVPVEIHKMNGLYYIMHPGVRPAPGLHPQKTLHKKLYNFYRCTASGKIHHCHCECHGEKIYSSESMLTCTISGQQFEAEQVRNFGINARIQNNTSADKSDPLRFSRDNEGRVMKTSGVHNTKEEHCKIIARDIIHMFLFSTIRHNSEINKLNDLEREGMKKVTKYTRSIERNKLCYNYLHMITIFYNEIKKRPVKLDALRKTKRQQNEVIIKFTKELIGYWKMILFKTNLGLQSPSQFNFKAFVPACLYIMKRGVNMQGQTIIRQDDFLSCCLPETNTLDVYKISKTPFTATKNNILLAIRDTIGGKPELAKELFEYSQRESNKVSI
jgi:hypothetical protein